MDLPTLVLLLLAGGGLFVLALLAVLTVMSGINRLEEDDE